MTIPLPAELRNVVASHPGETLELIDEFNRATYVLVGVEQFRRLTGAINDDLADTYSAQIESAMRAGWNDPQMDAYDDYDAHRDQP